MREAIDGLTREIAAGLEEALRRAATAKDGRPK